MARQHDCTRFFSKYRNFLLLIGFFLAVQTFLAVRVVFLHGSSSSSGDSGDGRTSIASHKNIPRGLPIETDSSRGAKSYDVGDAKNKQHGSKNKLPSDHILTNKVVHDNQTVNSSLLTLDLDSLSFVPECDISIKESISAIQRAKSQVCKEQLAKTACNIHNDSLYPKRLPRFCKNNETTYGKHIGCFKDDQKNRILSDYFALQKDSNSPQSCVDLCLQSGLQYAGVQYGVECFCGNTRPSLSLKLDSAECNMKCPSDYFLSENEEDNENPFCGGYFAMNVFETGVFHDLDKKNQAVGLDGLLEPDGTTVQPKKTVRIVFFLTLNGRALRQVFRLIKALFHERHYIYIHVDARQDYLYRELLVLFHKLPNNIRFMPNRRATIWGGASLLTILVNGMQDLTLNAKEWNWDWDYVINLSESDFPLKTTEKLETFLSLNNGRNFVKSHGRDVQKFIQKQGLDKTFDECEYRMWRMGDRNLPVGIVMDGGSDWISLHRDFVEYIVRTEDDLVKGLKIVFKHTLLPAESFFHTVLRNSALCESFVDNNLHVTNWKRRLGCKCQYRNVVDWCGCSPNDFRLADWNRLQLTENRLLFFGRKFESVINQGIVNKLESWLYPHRFEQHFPTIDRYWQSLYHHHDLSPKPDDALVTLGYSLSRIATREFTSKYFTPSILNGNINIKKSSEEQNKKSGVDKNEPVVNFNLEEIKLIEISAYTHDDQFLGILVKFENKVDRGEGIDKPTILMEAWFKLENWVTTAPWHQKISKVRSKIQDIRVGTDYDQKEQTFRNFARSLGPFSEPTLAYNVYDLVEPFNITFIWLNPIQSIQSVLNVTVTEGTTANFVKPVLKLPLLPGNWTVKVLTSDGHLVHQIKFLIMPLDFYEGKPISSMEARHVNTQPPESKTNGSNNEWKQSSQNLSDWIDDLVTKYYTVQDLCLGKEINELFLSRWNYRNYDTDINNNKFQNSIETLEASLCSHTQWSSLYPDPKSTILGIDPRNGLLVP